MDAIDKFLLEVRRGTKVLKTGELEGFLRRKSEIIVELAKRKIRAGIIEAGPYVRECLDIKDWEE